MQPSRKSKTTTGGQPPTNGQPAMRAAKAAAVRRLQPEPAPQSKLGAARAAVLRFLKTELKARESRVTKIGPSNHGGDGWLAEAEIFVPNLDIKTLGLPLTQEVLEREHYVIELDADLTVISYEVADGHES